MSEPVGAKHSLIRRLRALRGDPARRRTEGVLVAEGVHLAREALGAGVEIEFVVVSNKLRAGAEGRGLLAEVAARGLACFEAADRVLDSVQDARSSQGVVTVARRPRWPLGAGFFRGSEGGAPLIVVAWGLQDPGNLGSIVRTADGAGATACFVCGEGADPFHPRAVRATMGSIFRLPVLETPGPELCQRIRRHGLVAVGADPRGSVTHDRADLTPPLALFLGAEGRGFPATLVRQLDLRVRIPLRSGVESLSVGAAAAVVLFEAARQRASSAPVSART